MVAGCFAFSLLPVHFPCLTVTDRFSTFLGVLFQICCKFRLLPKGPLECATTPRFLGRANWV